MVESSAFYVGFRLQWILRIFLKGQKFPHGKLDDKQYMINVLQIVDFMTVEDNLVIMLDFDSASFFITVARLFVGMPWWFITKKGEYKFQFEKEEVAGAEAEFEQKSQDEEEICDLPIANKILKILRTASERSNRKNSHLNSKFFKELLLTIIIQQQKEFVGKKFGKL